jgi:tripartite-type tricarboxylate transporter receptor subunit TctC
MITRRTFGRLAALPLLGSTQARAQEAYPTRDLLGIIQWGAGGATDVTSRAVTPHAEAVLGHKIVLQNRPGGSGAIGMTAVHTAAPDGYTLLYAAENPLLYRVLNISRIDFVPEFYAVNVPGGR